MDTEGRAEIDGFSEKDGVKGEREGEVEGESEEIPIDVQPQ